MDKQLEKYLSSVRFESGNEEHKFQNLFYASVFIDAVIEDLPQLYGCGLKNAFLEIKGDFLRWAPDVETFDTTAEKYLAKLVENPDFGDEVNRNLLSAVAKVNRFSTKLLSTDLSKKTNTELAQCCEEYFSLLHPMIAWGFFSVIIEIRQPLFTVFLTHLVDKRNTENNARVSVGEAVAVLSSYQGETEAKREQVELLKLALKAKLSGETKTLEKELKQHADKFGWLQYGFSGPAWTTDDFSHSLQSLLHEDVAAKLTELQNAERDLVSKQGFFEKKLSLSTVDLRFFAIAQGFMKGKALRKEAMSFSAYAAEPLHKEIAKRLNLSFLQVRFMLLAEAKMALLKNKIDELELSRRTKAVVYGWFDAGKYRVCVSGKEAEKYAELIKEERVDVELVELRGTCACAGKATGTAKIINHPSEMAKMQKGDVLVSYATTPDIVSAMRLASAIVTDIGGLTSHAAIVSRELNVPCVIGTKIATKWLKDGDKVEVDAGNGVVRKL